MLVVSDTGPIISLSETCLLGVLQFLPFQVAVPPSVVDELVTFPLRTKHHKFSAIRIRELLGKGVIRTIGLSREARKLTYEIDSLANRVFLYHRRPLRIIHRGEIEALALAKTTNRVLVVDERTTRELIEDPEAIRDRLERRVGGRISINKDYLDELVSLIGDILVIRSVELVAFAADQGYFSQYQSEKEALEAALYALKYAGCSVSEEEIKRFVSGRQR